MNTSSFAARGGWWVAAQGAVLIGFVGATIAGRIVSGGGGWPMPWAVVGYVAGGLIAASGIGLMLAAATHLGRNLTAFPQPIKAGALVEHGAYALVRHPIYTGVIGLCAGWAFLFNSLIGLALVIVVLAFFDRKAAHEERMLAQKYPAYEAYRRRVRKLIPFVY